MESERLFSSATNLVTPKRTQLSNRVCRTSLTLCLWLKTGFEFNCWTMFNGEEHALEPSSIVFEPEYSNDEAWTDGDVTDKITFM